jgi:hypothetical protein
VELEEPKRGGASDHQAVERIAALRDLHAAALDRPPSADSAMLRFAAGGGNEAPSLAN